jgi:hypothetical protein
LLLRSGFGPGVRKFRGELGDPFRRRFLGRQLPALALQHFAPVLLDVANLLDQASAVCVLDIEELHADLERAIGLAAPLFILLLKAFTGLNSISPSKPLLLLLPTLVR